MQGYIRQLVTSKCYIHQRETFKNINIESYLCLTMSIQEYSSGGNVN